MNERSESNVSLTDLFSRVAWHMRMKYRVEMQDIEITDTPGYWRDKEPKIHPGHPLHACLGCEGPFRATYTFFDSPRLKGRFASPTRTWAALRSRQAALPAPDERRTPGPSASAEPAIVT